MHSHLDFANNCKEIARESKGKIKTINSTVTPASYVSASSLFAHFNDIHVALGIHPWWVSDQSTNNSNVAHFEELLQTSSLIGEVGLDFHKSHRNSLKAQTEVFGHVLEAIANAEDPKLVFLHAVKSYELIFDMLEKSGALKNSTFVFHCFQGSLDDLKRALRINCRFSVGARTLSHVKGEALVKAIPDDALLAETDNPPHNGSDWSCNQWLQEIDSTIELIAKAKGLEVLEVEHILEANSKALLQEFDPTA